MSTRVDADNTENPQTEARAIVRSASPTVRKLFDAIRESGSSEPDIADAAGVSHATLHYWRAGNRSPTIMLLEAVASVLGYNIELVKADHATDLAAKDAELAAVKSKCQALDDECQQSMLDISRERDRAERAEAQLAEARKALEQIERKICAAEHGHTINDVLANYREVRRTVQDARAARRALETQGGE